jgi:hypothetical protein
MRKPAINFFFLLALAAALGTTRPALAQGTSRSPQAVATLDSASILIGEQFHLTLQADPAGRRLLWAEIPDSFDHLLVVGRGKIDTVQQEGHSLYRQRLTLTGFDSGQWKVPAFAFRVVRGDSAHTLPSLTTDSLFIRVNTVAVDTSRPFRPIKQIRGVPFNILAYWYYILGGLVLLALLAYLIFFRKKKTERKPEKTVPAEPPYEQAMKSLHGLEAEKLWQQNRVKDYYTRLTDILRLYIERQFSVKAMEQTTDEILRDIRPVTRLNQQQDNLRYILTTADLAKFARLQPAPEEHEASLRKAYELLEWTRPRQEEKGQEADEKETAGQAGKKP